MNWAGMETLLEILFKQRHCVVSPDRMLGALWISVRSTLLYLLLCSYIQFISPENPNLLSHSICGKQLLFICWHALWL